MCFRCAGQTAARQADAQTLTLITGAWPGVGRLRRRRREDTFPSLHRLLHSRLGCSRCWCFSPETLVRAAISRKYGKESGKARGYIYFDHLGTYFFFFENFAGSTAGLSSGVSAGRGRERGALLVDGGLCACSGLGMHVQPSREPCKVKTKNKGFREVK